MDLLRFKEEGSKIVYYKVVNRIVFPLYGASGGIYTKFVVYLLYKGRGCVFKYAVKLKASMTHDEAVQEIQKCRDIFINQIRDKTAKTIDLDGGDLGRGDNELAEGI